MAAMWLPAIARADALPASGQVRGTYHRNRWGVGRFQYFIVAPDLHPLFAPLEGRPAEAVVTDSAQPLPSLPPLMKAVGKLTALPAPQVKLELSVLPARVGPGQPFQLRCWLRNRSADGSAAVLDATYFRLLQPGLAPEAGAASWLGPAYTQAQLATVCRCLCAGAAPLRTAEGLYANFCPPGTVLIPPGGGFPVAVVFQDALPAGQYEIEAAATYRPEDGDFETAHAWLRLDVRDAAAGRAWAAGLLADGAAVEPRGDAYAFRVRLTAPRGGTRRIVQSGSGSGAAWAGHLRAFAAGGAEVPLAAWNSQPKTTVVWQLAAVGPKGVEVHGLFRPASRFEARKIARVTLDLLTDRGVETFLLADGFRDSLWRRRPEPGEPADGVRLRVRAAAEVFRADEPPVFHVRAENTSGQPVCWPQRSGGGDNVLLEIDGKAAAVETAWGEDYLAGWTADWMCRHGEEWTIALPGDLHLSPGRHTLRYVLIGAGGTHVTEEGDLVPLLSGKVVSNEAAFTVK